MTPTPKVANLEEAGTVNRDQTPENGRSVHHAAEWREGLLRCLLIAIFLLFFQAYMVAPLIPYLAEQFGVTREAVGRMVPAYLLPYALGAIVYGLLADRFGRRAILFACLPVFAACCGLAATSGSVDTLILWRIGAGVAGGGIALITLTLAGDLFPVEDRGRALGWVFGAIAGGSAFGSTLGGMLAPLVGWRGLFIGVAFLSFIPLIGLLPHWRRLAPRRSELHTGSLGETLRGFAHLLGTARGRRTYLYVLLNGIFHSGTFTWLGACLHDRYHLSEAGIGLALLGYGVPGLFLGPIIGKLADRRGRGRILPWGLAAATVAGAALVYPVGLPLTVVVITLLSLGFDMTHPLLTGIVTMLAPERRGQAMGLNGFTVFMGFALGSLLFGWGTQRWGFSLTMAVFTAGLAVLGILAAGLFRGEGPTRN